jgi:hypothetical protein
MGASNDAEDDFPAVANIDSVRTAPAWPLGQRAGSSPRLIDRSSSNFDAHFAQ